MNRPWKIWLIFGVCLTVLLAAMGWVSLTVLRLDKSQQLAQAQADFEEKVRLALWRMDSSLAPLIVQESSRPYYEYNASYPAEEIYNNNRMLSNNGNIDVQLPSPLLTEARTNVLLHFQYGLDGKLTSPQVPLANAQSQFGPASLNPSQISDASNRLAQFRSIVSLKALIAACSTNIPAAVVPQMRTAQANVQMVQRQNIANQKAIQPDYNYAQQVKINEQEYQARNDNLNVLANNYFGQNNTVNVNPANFDNNGVAAMVNLSEGVTRPMWFGQALILARRVNVNKQIYLQGCWFNWPNIQQWLLSSVSDILPNARLEPLADNKPDAQGRMLASLPVRLVPGAPQIVTDSSISPIQFALFIAWSCVALAGIAAGVLLHGTVSLSERRGAFVSAVTHELRTPLTTFKMYSEMLAEGMVLDPAKQKQYLGTLCSEANRLSHLVENVLAYARLERGSARRRVEKITIETLLERVKLRLLQRAEQAGVELVTDSDERVLQTPVHVDVGAIEQILFNLVDNACKYAAPGATEKIIHLEALPDGKYAMLRVRDHGQGISKEGARRLFRPFSKSAHEAAHTAPGIGLGLALCRRLSRSMGGDLRLDQLVRDGACFVLTLPVAGSDSGTASASIG
jgi:signal transduction histidine kinase